MIKVIVVLSEQTQVFKCNNLTFILYDKEIIIKTPLQAFYLCSNDYWTSSFTRNRMQLIRMMLQIGEIKDLNELAGYTRPGIDWASTCILYDTSKCNIKVIL